MVCARLLSFAFHAPSSVLRERSILRRQALFLARRASSLRPLPFEVAARLASLREGAFQFSSEWLLRSKLATVRQGTQGAWPVPLCRLTLQSRGRAPASRVTPLISNVRHRVSQRAIPKSLSAFALRTWATPERAVRPASLAVSAPTEALEASSFQASARAARPLASGALPEFLATRVHSCVLVGPGASWRRAFHSRSRGEIRLVGRAACSSAAQVRSRSLRPCPESSLSASNATQSTAVFGSAAGVGVRSVALVQPASTIKSGCALPSALPNPSIERDVQGLSPSAAPHVKR